MKETDDTVPAKHGESKKNDRRIHKTLKTGKVEVKDPASTSLLAFLIPVVYFAVLQRIAPTLALTLSEERKTRQSSTRQMLIYGLQRGTTEKKS